MATQTQVQWTVPPPIWPKFNNGSVPQEFRHPALLRFASDEFMQEFIKTVNTAPARLQDWQAEPETWRGPATAPIPVKNLPTFAQRLHRLRLGLEAVSAGSLPPQTLPDNAAIPAGDLKLYQPAHQRFYLVTAGLVCTLPGLPDRLLDFNASEQTSFVIRRLLTATPNLKPTLGNLSQFDEYVFIPSPYGNRWQRLGTVGTPATRTLAAGEETHKLFGVTYPDVSGPRRILAGVIPVGKREVYAGAQLSSDETSLPAQPDPREAELQATVIQPWGSLRDLNASVQKRIGLRADLVSSLSSSSANQQEKDAALVGYDQYKQQTADQIQGASWLILLDFADYLHRYLKDVWNQLPNGDLSAHPGMNALLQRLMTATVDGRTFAQALVEITAHRTALEKAALPYPGGETAWPQLFSLADADLLLHLSPDDLDALVRAALAENPLPAHTPALPLASIQATGDPSQPDWYIIRCVFERPECADEDAFVFSQPTQPFRIASFFDPDAPARPIRISMPLDTSPAGLRKFNKNTAFVISDVLACQMERAGNLTLGDLVLSVLPWPFHKALPTPESGSCSETTGLSLGMICTLSIPIITICALILLMIIVSILDSIFHWLPFLIFCFPLPGLKAKETP